MWPSATSSRPAAAWRLGRALAACACLVWTGQAQAKVFLTQEEALALAFPDGVEVTRHTAFLTDERARQIEEAGGSKLTSKITSYYTGGGLTAYFDSHIVRTLPETVMIVVGPEATILRIDILSFNEPEEYLPRPRWLDQFQGKGLDEELSTRRGIRAVTGATLSSRAIVAAARRVLALHAILSRVPSEPEETKP